MNQQCEHKSKITHPATRDIWECADCGATQDSMNPQIPEDLRVRYEHLQQTHWGTTDIVPAGCSLAQERDYIERIATLTAQHERDQETMAVQQQGLNAVKDALDSEWTYESPLVIGLIASNGIMRRNDEITQLREENARLKAIIDDSKIDTKGFDEETLAWLASRAKGE